MVLKHTLSTKRYMRQYETEIRTRRRDTKVSHGRCSKFAEGCGAGCPDSDSYRALNVRSGQIRITGKSLEINYYTTTDMKITGKVEKIEYS